MRQTARYHYRHSSMGHMPPPGYWAYHQWWCLNYRNGFHLQNHRFFRAHFGGKKANFNGLVHGAVLQHHYNHYLQDFDNFYMFGADPRWADHSQVVKNYFGNKGWSGYKGYQDVDFEDQSVSSKYAVNFNSIVFKQTSKKQDMNLWNNEFFWVYGELNMRPSNVLTNRKTWEYFNTYGQPRNRRRFKGWQKHPLVRIYPGKIQNKGFQFAVSSFLNMNWNKNANTDQYAVEMIAGYYGHYPAMQAYRNHSWQWAYWSRKNKKHPNENYSYKFAMRFHNHWWPQHAKNVHFHMWDNYQNYVNFNIWSHYFRELDPRIAVANTEIGMENQFVPVVFMPRVVRAGMTGYSRSWWFGDNASYTQAATYLTGKDCNFWGQSPHSDTFMHLYKRTDFKDKKKYLNTICLQSSYDKMPFAYRSKTGAGGNGFKRECIGMNEIWNPKTKKCVPVAKNCKQKMMNKWACSVCDTGFEVQVKGDDGWKPRRWYARMKKEDNYKKYMGAAHKTRCRSCDEKHIWNPVIKECRPKVKKNNFVYYIPPISDNGKHYFFNLRRHYNSKTAALTFEIDVKNTTMIEGDTLAKVTLKYANNQISCDDGECFYKKLKKYRGVENKKCRFTHTFNNWVMHRNNNLKYCKALKKFKRTNSVRWYTELNHKTHYEKKTKAAYIKLNGSFVMREWKPDYAIMVEIFNTAGNYDQFFISDMKYRIDYKSGGGVRESKLFTGDTVEELRQKWNWDTRQANYNFRYVGADKRLPARKPPKSKEDFTYYETKLKKDKPINQRFRYLMNVFNPKLTVMQFWIKLDESHLNERDIPLLTMKLKRISNFQPVYYQLFADAAGGSLFMKRDFYNIKPNYKVKHVDWNKWQWMGIAAYNNNAFSTCVCLLSSAYDGLWLDKKNGYDCNPFPAFSTGVLGSFGTWDYNNANSKINARVYGGTIAHEILVNDYYVERNIFLNFDTNSRKHWFEVKNYARDDDKNNAVLVNINKLSSARYDDHVTRLYSQGIPTSEPYYMIKSKARNKALSDYGPLQSSYYISGYIDMKFNRYYNGIFKEDKWEKKIPIYKMLSRKGEVLIDLTHKLNFDKEERFCSKDNYFFNRFRKGKRKLSFVKRIRSKIDTRVKIIHPKTGKVADYINQDKQFESYDVNLEDYQKKRGLFMFNIFHRPTARYFQSKDRKFAFMLTVRHSWGVMQHIPMYYNDEFNDSMIRHLFATGDDAWTNDYLPVKHVPINFSVIQGPLKDAKFKFYERTMKAPKGSNENDVKVFNVKYKSRSLNKYNLVQDMHATFGKTTSYFQNGIEMENWASSFNPGQSFGCDHGFVLVNTGTRTVCTRPPAQDNNFTETINFDKFQTYSKNKKPLQKLLPVFDYFRFGHKKLKKNWSPFRHHYWDYYYYGHYYNSFHFYHNKYHRQNHKSCYVSDQKMILRTEKENIVYRAWRNKFRRAERECVACKKGYYLTQEKKKPAYFADKRVCKKCTRKACRVCAKKGCHICKEGFYLRLGSCIKCAKKHVWDKWSRRCFKRKKNRYMDIHYNSKDLYIMISDLFSVGKDVTGIFDFQIHWKGKGKPEPAMFELTSIQGGVESKYYYNFMPRWKKRRFFFRAPIFVGSDISLKLTIRGSDPKNFKFYKLRKFMYSLQPIINPENPRVDEKDHKELNGAVQIGNASHRKGFSQRKYFDDFVDLKIGDDVPEHLAEIRMWNERDEINGNWIQTWFKVNKDKPKKVNDITLISLHGELSSPYKGEFGFQMRLYYSYNRQALMFEDWMGQKKVVWSYKKYDVINQWSFVTLLIRKIFANDETRFEVHAATSYEKIFKILYNADDEPEEDDDRVRRLKLVETLSGRALDKAKSDESSVSDKEENDPNSDKTEKKQADSKDEKEKTDDAARVLGKNKADDESKVTDKEEHDPSSKETEKKQEDSEKEKKKEDNSRVLDKAKSDESSVSDKEENDPNSDKTEKKQADSKDEKEKTDDAARVLKNDLEGLNPEDLRYAQIERELEHDYGQFPVRNLGAKNVKKNDKAEKQAEENGGNSTDDEETKDEESQKAKEEEEQESRRLGEESEEKKGKKSDKDSDSTKNSDKDADESSDNDLKKETKDKENDEESDGNAEKRQLDETTSGKKGKKTEKDDDSNKDSDKDSDESSDGDVKSQTSDKDKEDNEDGKVRSLSVVDKRDLKVSPLHKPRHLLFRFPSAFMKMGSS